MFPTWSLFNFWARRLTTARIQLLPFETFSLRLAPWAFNPFYELNFFRPKPARPTKQRPSSRVADSGISKS